MARNELNGTAALVTGGSKGIGLGIAEALVDAGVDVTITARTESDVKAAAEALRGRGAGDALGLVCDVRDLAQQEAAVAQTVERFGGLDAMIANAGVGHFGPVHEMDPEDWQTVIDTNLTGAFYSIRAAAPALIERKGIVVTIGSLAGTNFFPTGSAYNASKFGLNGLSHAAMLDLRKVGVRVATIMPGSVATGFASGDAAEHAWRIQPEDLGQMVRDLLEMDPRTLPSKIEVRPSQPPSA